MSESVPTVSPIERFEENTRISIASSLECSLCLSLICEPISIACGHSFCRVCLVKSLRRHKKRCPSCREICHVQAETASENIMVKTLASMIDPAAYTLRLAESKIEKESWTALYPMFYYNSAMFPGGKLSLHLFEPRYKLMMQRVVNTTKSFAYVPNFSNYHARVGDVALVAKLTEVEFLADGRCLLDAVLLGRHQMVEHYIEDGTQGLHYCRLQPFHDDPMDAPMLEEAKGLMEQGNTYIEFVAELNNSKKLMEERYGKAPLNDVENFSLWLTGLSPLTEDEKLVLLLSKNTPERLARCVERLSQYINRVNQRKQISEMLTQAGSTIFSSAGTAIRNMVSFMTTSTDSEDEHPGSRRSSSDSGSGGDDLDVNEEEEDNEEDDDMQYSEEGHQPQPHTTETMDSESTPIITQQDGNN